jgi:hypothetical protein
MKICWVVFLGTSICSALQVADGPAINTFSKIVPVHGVDASQSHLMPMPVLSDSWKDPTTPIFVGIAHYRDQRCASTLLNLFSKAKHWERLRVGIIQPIHTEGDAFHCLQDFCQSHSKYCVNREEQFTLLEFTHQMARGPSYARYLQQQLVQDEDFCLQVDAHSDFIPHWDEKLTAMFGLVNNELGVLSTMPADISLLQDRPSTIVPHLCQATIKK